MSRDPNDIDTDEGEPREAQAVGDLVDDLLSGQPLPPAMDAEARALLAAATSIHASHVDAALSTEKSAAIIDSALEQAVLKRRPSRPPTVSDPSTISSIESARQRRPLLPWTIAAVAVAAAVMLLITRPRPEGESVGTSAATLESSKLDARSTSRPSDKLVGQIPRQLAAAASQRLDTIYADRLVGYRYLALDASDRGAR